MNKRAFDRTPVNVGFRCFDEDNFGIVENLSENGMFVTSEKIHFPLSSQFEIYIPYKSEELKIPVKISRITKSHGHYDGIGVELEEPNHKYLTLVNELKGRNRQ